MDEFQSIATLFRPLTFGAPEALALMDDAACIRSRPGFDLIITKDAMVQGVHFLADDPADLVARKLLRVNLSDLAAKGAEPYAYFLAAAWPTGWPDQRRATFAAGLKTDQIAFGLTLLGGDTVSTPGPLTLSVTMLGWVPTGAMVKRSGARAGDVVLVSGTIGDGCLGLAAIQDKLSDLGPDELDHLASRYRLPQPRTDLRETLRRYATAAADVSDGLLADAGHIAEASWVGLEIDLDHLPLSSAAARWIGLQPDRPDALMHLATGGDDYEIVCTVKAGESDAAIRQAESAGVRLTVLGRVVEGEGVDVFCEGRPMPVAKAGWTHP